MALFSEKLVSIARPVAYEPGARLVRQGEASRGAFLIRSGRLEAQVALPGGGMLAVAEFRDGDMFGEMSLIERGVVSASVLARTRVEGWFVGRDDFRALVASREPAALEMQREITRILAAKLRALNARVREHPAEEDVPVRKSKVLPEGKPSFAWKAFLPLLRFFEGFDEYEIEEVAALGRAFELPRGARLFDQGAAARVRESACLLELPAADFMRLYGGSSGASVSLQHAIHASLLRSLARTNNQLTRLISAARLRGAHEESRALEAARASQIVDTVE